ncbi:hypothetical protein H5073_17990 [Shewanella sp. SR44-3]|nr:hypothetical protein [Shewanella sp. SR44-3]
MFVLTCLLTFVFFVIGQRYEHHPYRKKDLPIVLGILLPSYGFFSWLIVNAIFVSLVTFDVLTHKSSQVLVDVTSKSCSTVKGQVNCYLIINGEKHYLPIERLQNIQLGKANVVIREYWLGTKIE